MSKRSVLNVGGNSKDIPIPAEYNGWEHLLLDIDPRGKPDICCDARTLDTLDAGQFDAIYCSHNLEHYYRHDVFKVLRGFKHVLKDDGFAHIRVPDMMEVMKQTIDRGLDIDDVLYQSAAGPIAVRDVMYGWGAKIEQSGEEFFAHKTGFSKKSLNFVLATSGFPTTFSFCDNLEVTALAFKGAPSDYAKLLWDLA